MFKKIKKRIIKFFFNRWYKIKPPEMAVNWQKGKMARAKVTKSETGSLEMHVEGEKYPHPGFPRGYVLNSTLGKLKKKVKDSIFNDAFEAISEMMEESKHDMLPPERMTPAVQELWRAFEELENAEVTEDMKGRINLIKRVLCFFFQEDDSYRFRAQWLYERIDGKKFRLSKADKYWFRAKYFKVDHPRYDY